MSLLSLIAAVIYYVAQMITMMFAKLGYLDPLWVPGLGDSFYMFWYPAYTNSQDLGEVCPKNIYEFHRDIHSRARTGQVELPRQGLDSGLMPVGTTAGTVKSYRGG